MAHSVSCCRGLYTEFPEIISEAFIFKLSHLAQTGHKTLATPKCTYPYLFFHSKDWRNRLMGIAQLELALSSSSNLAITLPYLDSLLRTLLSSERHFDVSELKRELLVNLISRLPLDNLEERTPQILTGLCRQGNAGANRVCKALMQRLPAGTIVAKLTSPEFLHAKSSKVCRWVRFVENTRV